MKKGERARPGLMAGGTGVGCGAVGGVEGVNQRLGGNGWYRVCHILHETDVNASFDHNRNIGARA